MRLQTGSHSWISPIGCMVSCILKIGYKEKVARLEPLILFGVVNLNKHCHARHHLLDSFMSLFYKLELKGPQSSLDSMFWIYKCPSQTRGQM